MRLKLGFSKCKCDPRMNKNRGQIISDTEISNYHAALFSTRKKFVPTLLTSFSTDLLKKNPELKGNHVPKEGIRKSPYRDSKGIS